MKKSLKLVSLAIGCSIAVSSSFVPAVNYSCIAESTNDTEEGNLNKADTFKYNGHSYYVFSGVADSIEEAQAYCEKKGGYLAVINDQEENDQLYNGMHEQGYDSAYFGYSDSESEGEWHWIGDYSSDYENWSENEPNGEEDENTAMFYYKCPAGKWNDGHFGAVKEFICEWDTLDIDESTKTTNEDNSSFNTYGGHTYKIFDKNMTWEAAKSCCESLGGHLVTISDKNEQGFIDQMLQNKSNTQNCYWIGLYKEPVGGYSYLDYFMPKQVWYWVDDTGLQYHNCSANMTDFGAYIRHVDDSDADNEIKKYGYLYGNDHTEGENTIETGQWNSVSADGFLLGSDFYASENFGFICEWDTEDVVEKSMNFDDVKTFRGHTYKILDESLTWNEAESYCEKLGGHLVTISDFDEHNFISKMLKNMPISQNCYWIGLYKDIQSTEWFWINEPNNKFFNWTIDKRSQTAKTNSKLVELIGKEEENDINIENYAHIFGNFPPNESGLIFPSGYNCVPDNGAEYIDNFYAIKNFGFICEWDYYTNDEKDPIILIPGIMGSRLFADEECTELVWDPEPTLDGLSNLRKNASNDILYVKDPSIKQNYLLSSEREYGAINCMEDLVDNLCYDLPFRDIYVFSYDWRKSNVESAAKLNEFINSLNVDKVDIVAHSMGGLVVSWYYKTQGGDKLDKVITCGTPYEGAPHLLEVVDKGNIRHKKIDNFALLTLGGLTYDVKRSMDGVAELIPTPKYCESFPVKKKIYVDINKANISSMTDNEYKKMINNIFGTDRSDKAFDFMEKIKYQDEYNCLCDYEKSYYIVGSKATGNSKYTAESLTYDYVEDPDNEETSYYNIKYVKYTQRGDGTVPYYSATMAKQLLSKVDPSRIKEVTADHLDVINKDEKNPDDDPIAWIEDILKDNEPDSKSTTISYTPYQEIQVACPVDVEIGSGDDRLCSAADDISLRSSFGRLDIIGKDSDIKMICMDEDTNLDINLTGTDTGTMDFTVRHFSADEELLDERIFENVPLTDKTIIKTKADNNEVTVLNVDVDGDGVVDETWTAKKNETVKTADEKINVTTTISATTTTSTTTSTTTGSSIKTTDVSTTTANPTSATILGDVNDDKIIDGKDATAILTEYAKTSTGAEPSFSLSQQIAADVNSDNAIDGRDATAVLSFYAYISTGKTTSLAEFVANLK